MKIKNSYKIFSLLLMLLLSSCLSTVSETTCGDGEAYDAEDRTCVPTIAEGPNTIFINSSFPTSSAYVTNLTSSAINHSITVSNQYNNDFSLRWTIYTGIISNTLDISNSTYTLVPSSLINTGNYILEAGVYSPDGTVLYDSKTWNITVEGLTSPTLTNTSPAIFIATYPENAGDQTLSADITNPDALNGTYNIIVDGDLAGATTGTFTSATANLSTTIDPEVLGVGSHSVEFQLLDAVGTNRYDSYAWQVNIIEPDLPQIDLSSTLPSLYAAVSVIDGISFQDTSASPANQLLSGYRDSNGDPINQFCVVVDNSDKDGDGSSDIYLDFEINGAKQGSSGFFASGSNTYCHETFNIQNLVNSDVSESRTLVIKSFNVDGDDLIETVQYDISVRPTNLRPLITIDSSTNVNAVPCSTLSSTVLYTDCAMTQSVDVENDGDYSGTEDLDNAKDFAISFITDSDPDLDISDPAQYNVYFEIKSIDSPVFQALDGVTNTLTSTSCSGTSSLSCGINIDAFSSTGNIPPGTYTVQAYLSDVGSQWELSPTPKQSNTVSWVVEVAEAQSTSSIAIANQSASDNFAGLSANESWLENTMTSCTGTNSVVNENVAISENEYITVHTYVKENERDDFKITMTMTNGLSGGVSPVVSTTTIVKSDDSEYTEVINCFRVPEYVVSGATDDLVSLTVYTADVPDEETAQSATNTFTVTVNNYNPSPTFDDNSDVDLSGLNSYAGLPFNLSAPTFNDLNTMDGDVISFAWEVSDDNTNWEVIPGANSTDQVNANLVWTAPPSLTGTVSFRLCLGDDGVGNAPDCSITTATKQYLNLNVAPSEQTVASNTGLNTEDKLNIATWFDDTNQNLYTTYSIGTEIHVNKQSTSATGELVDEHSISFSTDIPTASSTVPENLSISGSDGQSLIIAYNMLDSAVSDKRVRIRRIDISDNLLSFNYGGFFNGDADTNDRIDNISAGVLATGTGVDIAAVADGDMLVTANSYVAGDEFSIQTGTGNVIYLTVGTGVGEVCETVACSSDPVILASNIANFINNHADLEISKELYADYIAGNTFLTIRGANVDDYYNGQVSMPYIGNISIHSDGRWAIPFINTNNSSQLDILYGSNANSSIASYTGVYASPITGAFNKSPKGKFLAGGEYIATTINNNNNIDIYRFNSSYILETDSIQDAFTLGSFTVTDYDLDIGTDGTTEYIYIAGKLEDSSTGESKVGVIMSETDLTSNYVATETLTNSNFLTEDIELTKISGSQTNAGEATLAIITSNTNSSPDSLHIAKITHPMTTATYVSTEVELHVSTDTNYVTPAISSSILVDSTVALTKSFTTTKGHLSESSDTLTEDVIREIFYTSSLTDDGTNEILKINTVNTHAEDVMTSNNDDSPTLSAPALIKN